MQGEQAMTDEVEDYAERASQRATSKATVKEEIRKALHKHPRDLVAEHRLTFGETSAGFVARHSGSWPLILGYMAITIIYLMVNRWVVRFDATLQYYTFAVSVLAIFLAQVILLFQNRQADLESSIAHNAYAQTQEIWNLQPTQVELLNSIRQLTQELRELNAKVINHIEDSA